MSKEYHFDVSGDARVIVSMPSGRVDVTPSGDGVDISISGDDELVEVDQTGNTITVTAEKKRGIFTSSARVNVAVPPGTDFELSGASVDANVEAPLGSVRSKTASGDIDLGRVRSLSVRSASGDVRVDAIDRDCDIALASGDLFAGNVEGDLSGSVASGDVRVESVGGRVSVKSASGDIRIDRVSGTETNIKSMSGTVAVGIARGTRVNVNMNTLSGEIYTPKSSSDGVEPVRTMRLNVKTVSGDIHISRAD